MYVSVELEQSNFIISDLEEELKEVRKKSDINNKELLELKEKKKSSNNTFEREIEQTRKERELFKIKFVEFEKKVIELENINEMLESDLRASKASLLECEQRIEKTMEELAVLQIQVEEKTENNQEQVARLRSQLKETEDELYAWQFKHQNKEKEREVKNEETKIGKENIDESFHSKQSVAEKKNDYIESKIRKKNQKFAETLAEMRSYIEQLSIEKEEISKRYPSQN